VAQHGELQYVGIDAHQDSLSVAVLVGEQEGVLAARKLPNQPARIRAFFERPLANPDASTPTSPSAPSHAS